MPASDEKLIEWLKGENEVLFRKLDKQGEKFEALERSVRDLERTFITHSPCAQLRAHLADHGEIRKRWWDVWSKVVVAAIVGAGAALMAVWKKL